jgi:hypothetical protein
MARLQEFTSSRARPLQEEVANRDWFHGTDSGSADSVATRQRADFRGVQVHGPGLYVTPDFDNATTYARAKAYGTGKAPVVQSGIPMTENPVSVTHRQLVGLGQQFREQHPSPANQSVPDAHLGNLALRQRGHDFMHVTEGVYGSPTDVGVILRPNKWMALEDHEPKAD